MVKPIAAQPSRSASLTLPVTAWSLLVARLFDELSLMMVGMAPESAGLGPSIKVAAIVNFYGISDVPDQLQGPHLQTYAVNWIPEQPGRMELAKKLSPITYVRKGLPPVLSIHGDADPVVPYDQSVRLTRELKAAGDQAELITVPAGQHGFPPDEMNQLWPRIFKWLKKHKISS